MNKIQKEQLTNVVSELEKVFDSIITLKCIKDCNNGILDFKKFYFIIESKHIKHYEQMGEGFEGTEYVHLLKLYLDDDSTVKIMLKRDTFAYDFLLENTINIDTVECMQRLNDIYDSGYLVTKLRIDEPACLDYSSKDINNREMSFWGLKSKGKDKISYSSITEVGQDVINIIP